MMPGEGLRECPKACPWIGYGLDDWTSEIRVVCHSLGTATTIKAPKGWEDGDKLPDCKIELGIENPYCPYYKLNLQRADR